MRLFHSRFWMLMLPKTNGNVAGLITIRFDSTSASDSFDSYTVHCLQPLWVSITTHDLHCRTLSESSAWFIIVCCIHLEHANRHEECLRSSFLFETIQFFEEGFLNNPIGDRMVLEYHQPCSHWQCWSVPVSCAYKQNEIKKKTVVLCFGISFCP